MLESSWVSESSSASVLWRKLRNVMKAVALFRLACSSQSSEIAINVDGDKAESKLQLTSGQMEADGCSISKLAIPNFCVGIIYVLVNKTS